MIVNLMSNIDARMTLTFLVFGAAFAASRPKGLQRLVLASGLASKELSIRGIQLRRGELPQEVLHVMEEYEKKQDYENPAYLEAQMIFNKTFVCRQEPPPSELLPAFKNLRDDETVYSTMYVLESSFLFYLSLTGAFRTVVETFELVRAARSVDVCFVFCRFIFTLFVRHTPACMFGRTYPCNKSHHLLTKPFSSGPARPSMCLPARCSDGQASRSCHRSPRQLLFTTESTTRRMT